MIIFAVFVLLSSAAQGSPTDSRAAEAQAEAAHACVERYERAWSRVQGLTFVLSKQERMRDGRLIDEEIFVKQRRTGQLYVAAKKPRRGQEIIYDRTRDPDQFVVHPGRFPDLTLTLALRGDLATRDQHHLVTDLGFDTPLRAVRGILGDLARRASAPRARVQYSSANEGEERKESVAIVVDDAKAYQELRPQRDETVFSFAQRHRIWPYLLVYSNSKIAAITDTLDADQTYRVPEFFGSRIEIEFDSRTSLPRKMTVWDSSGQLYEQYAYRDVALGVTLTDTDFDRDNPAYAF